ncbi:very long chain fatty acid elongase 4-like isoform X5 [Taeniopygia guttata]|uniref:very long chain fatty acid elongase 4-like isoform X5 n=1 Tax=Taeniopygia guttata TaxID=59729 RepID=UPI003BB9701F
MCFSQCQQEMKLGGRCPWRELDQNLGWLQLGRKLRNSTTGFLKVEIQGQTRGHWSTPHFQSPWSSPPTSSWWRWGHPACGGGGSWSYGLRCSPTTWPWWHSPATCSMSFWSLQSWPTTATCASQWITAGMARVCWWFFFSKVIELLDTVFLILRKKQEQVTFLHVYHHGSMLFNWWSGVKYVPGGQAFFVGMLNSFVHIFMYGYYALASLGPRMRRHLWWKRYLTILQLCQFVAIAAHSSYNLFTECPFPDGFNTAVFLYILSLLALFLRFYYHTYVRGKQEKLT